MWEPSLQDWSRSDKRQHYKAEFLLSTSHFSRPYFVTKGKCTEEAEHSVKQDSPLFALSQAATRLTRSLH